MTEEELKQIKRWLIDINKRLKVIENWITTNRVSYNPSHLDYQELLD